MENNVEEMADSVVRAVPWDIVEDDVAILEKVEPSPPLAVEEVCAVFFIPILAQCFTWYAFIFVYLSNPLEKKKYCENYFLSFLVQLL